MENVKKTLSFAAPGLEVEPSVHQSLSSEVRSGREYMCLEQYIKEIGL